MKKIILLIPLMFLIAAAPAPKKKVVENQEEYMPGTNIPIENVNTSPNPTPDEYESQEAEEMTIKKIDNPVQYQKEQERKKKEKKSKQKKGPV